MFHVEHSATKPLGAMSWEIIVALDERRSGGLSQNGNNGGRYFGTEIPSPKLSG
jgi:hypothetical protein